MTKGIWPFIDNEDGTVTDIRSKLVWVKSPIQISKTDYNNSSILVRNIKSEDYGINDNSIVGAWRLPTLQEFKSFVEIYANIDESKYNTPYDWLINRGFTANKDALYWSATSSANDPDGAWAINLLTGKADYPNKISQLYVWPVRSKSESQSAKSEPVVAMQPVNVVTNNITTLNNQKPISCNYQLQYNAVKSYNDKSERSQPGTEKVGNFIVGTAIICYAIMIILAIVLSIVSIIIDHLEGVILGLLIALFVYLKMDSDRR